ncbi:threonine dehydratase [Rhodoligotrophos appendicifer]|uniref:threonine ammonia-lyase n=1 Tax=Rhodoligotrophos appendicifer TaxID=987056 RepID=UPI001186E501|nr:threonine/serine dehydratase [Rhodoligotrophos appendicifer]
MHPERPEIPSFDDIQRAAVRIQGQAIRTPLLNSPKLDERLGFRLFVKAEVLQRTGSFKFRGAYNSVSQLSQGGTAKGIVAFSSGNHGQGVAAAAQLCGLPAVIVMPADSPPIKLRNTASYGAEVVTFDRAREDRVAIAATLAEQRNAVIVPPFDDPQIISGQGTVGLEIADQAEAEGISIDHVVVPASGGGLVAGISLALEHRSPHTKIWCAEPEGFDDHARSLTAGSRQQNAQATGSICDALMSREPGALTFAINRLRLAGGLVANDDEVRSAMGVAFDMLKLVIEPGGAVALAAVLSGKLNAEPGQAVVVVASGGNVDRDSFAAAING